MLNNVNETFGRKPDKETFWLLLHFPKLSSGQKLPAQQGGIKVGNPKRLNGI
jgi:hypothetical protein